MEYFGQHCELKVGFLPGKHFVAKGRLARLFPCLQEKVSDVRAYKTRLNKSECYIFHTTKTSKFGHRNVKNIGLWHLLFRKKLHNTPLPPSPVVAPKNVNHKEMHSFIKVTIQSGTVVLPAQHTHAFLFHDYLSMYLHASLLISFHFCHFYVFYSISTILNYILYSFSHTYHLSQHI